MQGQNDPDFKTLFTFETFLPVLINAFIWLFVSISVKFFSKFTSSFNNLTKIQQINWEARIMGLLHALLVLILVFLTLPKENNLKQDPIFGYSENASKILSISCGYFLWDTIVCILNFKIFGFAFLIHGLFCFIAYYISMTPLVMYYGLLFLLFEASTPFIHLHWILGRCNYPKNHPLVILLGILVILTFGGVRLCLGPYWAYLFFLDIRKANISNFLLYYLIGSNWTLVLLNFIWARVIVSYLFRGKSNKKEQ
eukprot:TRINITY_DN651_c0_g3_i1.p1 TRINITY_DN651_c0_g3~~TRINITY_DN651_c0_g3_i1.p1  ORF type:complete len:254 (-),score=66.97 TRINITY_DN651_c0_g3_i1:90-851(-)